MKRHLLRKIILSTSVVLMGGTSILTAEQLPLKNEVKALQINESTTDYQQLKQYYTQEPIQLTNQYFYARKDTVGHFAVQNKPNAFVIWFTTVSPRGADNYEQLLALEGHQVDIFGLKDRNTDDSVFLWNDFVTGGVTKTSTESDETYTLNAEIYQYDRYVKSEAFLTTKKPTLTLKEIDFMIRKKLTEDGLLYDKALTKGEFHIFTKEGDNISVDLRKRLPDQYANKIIKEPNKVNYLVTIEEKKKQTPRYRRYR